MTVLKSPQGDGPRGAWKKGHGMEMRNLGSTGMKVSPIGLGLMRLPLEGGGVGFTSSRGADFEAGVSLIRHAIDSGINYVDTAFNYLHGESEKVLGAALQDGYRDKVIVATKSPIWMLKEKGDFDSLLAKQMGRLKTDHIDVYLLHCVMKGDWKNKVLPTGTIESLIKAKEDGRVGAIGFSFHDTTDFFKEVVDYAPWDICQIQLNYLDQEFQGGLAAARYAASKGMGVIAMEPLRGGHLANVPDRVADVFNTAERKREPIEWAFDFLWDKPEISLLLSGMTYPEQIDENAAYAARSHVGMLSAEEKALYDKAIDAFHSYNTIPCTGCNYCADCPEGVAIPYNFQTYNQYVLSGDMDRAKWEWETSIPLNGARANACIECGTCEERCPQHIEIIKELKKVTALFE